jgi:hypothetical protein
MKTTQILAALAIGTVVFAAGNIQASENGVAQKLNISGTFSYQTNSYSSPVETYKIVTKSFNNKKIIEMLNSSSAFTNVCGVIPANAYLVLIGDNVYATNKAGFSADLSASYYSTNYEEDFTPVYVSNGGEGYSVYSGKYNTTTYADSEQGLQSYSYIDIDDGQDNWIEVQGLGKYSYSASKISNGVRTVSSSGSITGSGDGYIQGTDGVVQGKGTASGSGKVTVEE